MKKKKTLLYLALLVLINLHVFGQVTTLPAPFGPHQWSAIVKVIGEDGNPIAGADVTASYDFLSASGKKGKGISWDEISGLTDTNGMFSVSNTDTSYDLGITGKKSGYYPTHIGYQFDFDEKKWHPTFTLMLKKIGKPIAMYAKRLNTHVPALDRPIGFDLMAGDWIAPYGKGVSSDILFTGHFDKSADGESDFTLTVGFPKAGDGIQEFTVPDTEKWSVLRSSQEAPTNGYLPQWVQTDNRKPGKPIKTNRDPNRNYYIRVCTILDENGNVMSARYGKIYGDFMEFTYYYNPTPNDRDIEFDSKQNLFSKLSWEERVSQP